MRTLTRRVAALAVVSTLTLAGCGGSDDDKPDTDTSSSASDSDSDSGSDADSDVAPATGDVITADGFSFNAPEGWTDAKDVNPAAVALAANRQDTDGFADNVNVIEDPTVVDADIDELESSIERVLKNADSQEVEVEDPTDIDGEEAARISALLTLNGNKYRTEQFAVDHDGKGYIVTFSFSETVSDDDRDELAESVLATWKWSK
ncbi:hypothetical protein [Aeromicrobium endophyticum]|uniref:hypothetical protein n=1 Tax=Aeromicrobium endophyticum TaxID=2292704 RepID=UPI0013141B5B|nr:hypothetical protein [Aeromicrobium endophyticum]